MTMFTILYVRRSDGKLETVHNNVRENNGPTAEQLDATPNENGDFDYYREIQPGEFKHQQWLQKLGRMFMQVIGFDKDLNRKTLNSLTSLG